MNAESTPADDTPTGAAPPQSPLSLPWLPLACAVALALFHFAWLRFHFAPAIMSPDSNGYVAQARLIAESGRTSFTTTSPAQFVGMHWLETPGGIFHSRYPAGLPLLFAAAWKVGGLDAALLVNPLLASATLLLVFHLARRFVSGWSALLAATVVAVLPVMNQHALDADAHTGAAFFLVAGILALLRFVDTRAASWGWLAGMLLGVVPTIRYPEAIVGLSIGAWLLWRVRPAWRIWPAAAGAALPLGALFVHNAAAYGAFWRTGYALTNEQTGFGLNYFTAYAVPYLQSLGGQGLSLFFAFGAAGLAALAVDRRWRAEGVLFVGLVVPLTLLYMAYYFGGAGGLAAAAGGGAAGGNMRFLIPIFPFFAVAGVWLLSRMVDSLGSAGRAAVAVVAVLQVIVAGSSSMQTLARTKTSLVAAASARALAEKQIPAGSVVIVDRQLAESFDAVGKWRIVDENLVGFTLPRGGPGGIGGPGRLGGPGGLGGAGRQSGRPGVNPRDPDAPNPQQIDKNRAQRERYAGLTGGERRTRMWADMSAWAGGRPIYWFARSIDLVEDTLPTGGDYENIAEIDAPTMRGPGMGQPAGGGPGGPGRGMQGQGRVPGGWNPIPMGPSSGPWPGPGLAGGPGPAGRAPLPNANAPAARLRVVKILLPSA